MRQTLIQNFCAQVNEALTQNKDCSMEIYEALKATITDDSLLSVMDDLKYDFDAANHPDQFVNLRVTTPDLQLDQCYGLLNAVLGEEILDPKEAYMRPLS